MLPASPADFLLISGDDMLTVPLIACGAVGVISVLANAFPKRFADLTRAALTGDYAAARAGRIPSASPQPADV